MYKDRLLDVQLKRHLKAFGAVEIIGAMWCGKTWMAEAHGASKINLSDPKTKAIIVADHSLAFDGDIPHVIDEWQEIPALWDAVRLHIDSRAGEKGLFILTGSSTPKKEETRHSGTGRISRLHLRPMSLFETGDSDGSISLSGLFDGSFKKSRAETDLKKLSHLICKGGWPGALHLTTDDTQLIPNQYLDTLISFIGKRNETNEYRLRRFLVSLARNTGQAVTYNTIAADIMDEENVNRKDSTVKQQIETLLITFKDRFIIEDLYGWDAPVRSKSRVRVKPKHCFVDPSLIASLLGVNRERLLQDGQLFGILFEELALRDLRIYASAMDNALPEPVRYYRDSDNLEVDAIIELRDGRWAGIEIKLSENKVKEGIDNLIRLRKKVMSNPAARNPEPAFLAVICGKADFCRITPEGVYVFPLTSLTV